MSTKDIEKKKQMERCCYCERPETPEERKNRLEVLFKKHKNKLSDYYDYPIYYYDPTTKEIIKGSNILPHEEDFKHIADLIYIGDGGTYQGTYVKLGIREFFTKSSSRVACVGKNPETGEWFGWSHRGYGKFYPGYVVKEGSMLSEEIAAGYSPQTENHCRVLAFIFAELMD